jgi:hypothetical protein
VSDSIGLAVLCSDAETARTGDPEAAPLTRRQMRERERIAASAAASVAEPVPEPVLQTRRQRRAREAAAASAGAALASVVAAGMASASAGQPVAVEVEPIALVAPAQATPLDRAPSTAPLALAPSTIPRAPRPVGRSIRVSTDHHARPLRTQRPNGTAAPIHAARSHRKRKWTSIGGMLAASGLIVTFALPAYAYSTDAPRNSDRAASVIGSQKLSVADVSMPVNKREGYTTIENVAAWDSTTGNTVAPTVQALATKLMSAVAAGTLLGSNPDHIPEIRNLANGVAVPGCGIDYRVLQVIQVALDNFNTVRVSDINRRCTGQLEGAGAASAHYADGGGHAVDFDMLNGHALTGGDADSMRLVHILDPLVPPATNLGQAECRSSVSLQNFIAFDDSCTHLHIDFGAALGTALRE